MASDLFIILFLLVVHLIDNLNHLSWHMLDRPTNLKDKLMTLQISVESLRQRNPQLVEQITNLKQTIRKLSESKNF